MSTPTIIRELIATLADTLYCGDLRGHLRAWKQTCFTNAAAYQPVHTRQDQVSAFLETFGPGK